MGRVGVWLTTGLISVSIFAMAAFGQPLSSQEYQLKASFLYNFANFVKWPAHAFASSTDPIVFCVLGDDPFGPALDATLNNKTIGGRALVAKRTASEQGIKGCHLLFIGDSETKRLTSILSSAKQGAVLTIGEDESFLGQGGMIVFIRQNRKLRFAVNLEAVRGANLKLSANLLRLALFVAGKEP